MFVFFALVERKKDKREKRKYRSAEGKEAPTLRRLPNLRLAVLESELVWGSLPIFRGLVALPVTWN
jgi:hypothetical protein